MKLFKTKDDIFTKHPDQPFFEDSKGNQYYPDVNNKPVDNEGNTINGFFITKFVFTQAEYLEMYPEGKNFTHILDAYLLDLMFFQTLPNHSCIPGSFYTVRLTGEFRSKSRKFPQLPKIIVGDGDDGYVIKSFLTIEEAKQGLEELKSLAPFIMSELREFGYKF